MRILHQTLLVVLGCALGGLSVVSILALRYREGQRMEQHYGTYQLFVRDLGHLQTMSRQWLVTIDLFFGYEQTYLADGINEQSEQLTNTWLQIRDGIDDSPLTPGITRVLGNIELINQEIQQAAIADGEERAAAINRALKIIDKESMDLAHATGDIGDKMQAKAEFLKEELGDYKDRFHKDLILLVSIYIVGVCGVWSWTSRSIVKPLEELGHAAHRAIHETRVIAFSDKNGPREVRELAKSLGRFASELQEASRKSGIAEVATSVVHNVGNILNSINTSLGLLQSTISDLRISNIRLLADACGKYKDNPADFLTRHPAGRKLHKYLETLVQYFEKKQATLIEEVARVHEKVGHVNAVVRSQQNHAKSTEIIETFNVETVLWEAISIVSTVPDNESIPIKMEGETCRDRQLVASRSKVMQVFINLIKNAAESIREAQPDRPLISVKAETNGNQMVTFFIRDNGIGISTTDQARLFQHGFTTKKYGYGFGLHGAALLAKEMGGSLHLESPGVGHGATAVFVLPAL